MYLFPQPRRRLRGFRGLGMNPHASGDTASAIIGPGYAGTFRALAPRLVPVGMAPTATPRITGPYTLPGSPSVPYTPGVIPQEPYQHPNIPGTAATAGTPVPASFNQNSIFVASDGSQWIFSASQGKWISVGTPYNVGAPSAPVAPTAGGGAFWPNSPVPSSWPAGQTYTDANGNVWAYNAGYGTFQEQSTLGSQGGAGAAGGVNVSSTPGENTAQSILDWASQSTWIPPIPNWVVGGGLGLLAWKFLQPSPAAHR